ncbi:MAG: restriction endonuclease [Verrucomicrobiota bacterium]
MDSIYVQAKRWQSTAGRPEIQSFLGAMMCKHAHKGVFITTCDFQKSAIELCQRRPAQGHSDQRPALG